MMYRSLPRRHGALFVMFIPCLIPKWSDFEMFIENHSDLQFRNKAATQIANNVYAEIQNNNNHDITAGCS